MPTIADVAKLAGVSTGTVSRVMNGSENVTPETRTRVNQAIASLGYAPNVQARSLRSKRTDTIALAIPELANDFWTTIARGVQDMSQAKGYHVLICNTGGRNSNYLNYLEQMVNRVDGMILSRRSERVIVAPNKAAEKPIVFVGQSQAATWNVDNVYSDSISGAFALTTHLIGLGHQKIAIITGKPSSNSAGDRVAGFAMALADAGIALDPERICRGEYDRKTAERLTYDLLDRLPDTTAIVAANNEIAIGVIQALEKRCLPVPDAVAVVCFDDFYPDSRFATLMTAASQSPYDLGINAAQLLLNRLNSHEHLRPQTIVLPPRMIVRRSCGGEPSPVDENNAFDNVQGQLIAPLPRQKLVALAAQVRPVVEVTLPPVNDPLVQNDKLPTHALKQALRSRSDSAIVPHFEYAVTGASLYRYLLEREPETEIVGHTEIITPEDQVEFAQRSGIAAIPCRFPYLPVPVHSDNGDGITFEFPLLTDAIDLFDRYVRAARSSNVGIAGDFRGIVSDTLRIAAGTPDTLVNRIADELVYYQTKFVQLICDRFRNDLAFILFSDTLADEHGLCVPSDVFEAVFAPRIRRLIRPAREHGLPVVLHTGGNIGAILPLIAQTGFDAVSVAEPELNDMPTLRQQANGTLSLMGGIPVAALMNGTRPDDLRAMVRNLAAGGGYVAGVSGEINDDVPVANYLMLHGALSPEKNQG